MHELGRHRERRADTESAERPRIHPVAGFARLHGRRGDRDDVAAVADVNRVVGQKFIDLVSHPIRIDRHGLGFERRQKFFVGFSLRGAELFHPFGALRVSFRGAAGSGLLYGFENRAAIADHAERNVAVLADVAVVEIDLHDGRVGAQTPPITETKIERAADDQNHVGFVERQTTRAIEAVWIARREDAAS